MPDEPISRIELDRLAKLVRENELTIDRLNRKLYELAQFTVNLDEHVEKISESVDDIRRASPGASAKAAERVLDRMRRQSIKFRQERRADLIRRT